MSSSSYWDGYFKYPMAVDGDVDFAEFTDWWLLQEAKDIFAVQWDYVHGYVDASALADLPEEFDGQRVVRDSVELDELARIGAFDIEELYRELYG